MPAPASALSRWTLALCYPLATTALVALLFWPDMVHLFDFGDPISCRVEDLATYDHGSRNILLRALPRVDLALDETLTSLRYQTSQTTTYTPLVSPDWTPGQPVRALLLTGYGLSREKSEVMVREPFLAELHNVAWEGIDDDIITAFRRNKLAVLDDVVLVQLPGSTSKLGLVIAIVVFLASSLGSIVIVRGKA